jgi:CheY-like chemotaxis protein
MTTRRVLFLDDDADLRTVFASLMTAMGISVATVATVDELEKLVEQADGDADGGFDLAILDINLGHGEPSGLDAYRWLKQHRFAGRMVFLTGHARSHPLVSEARRLGDVGVYDKPISVAELRQLMS